MSDVSPQNSLVVKSNALIESRYALSVAEIRIITLMIAQINREDEDFRSYRIYIKDLLDYAYTKHKGEYERMREITKGLMQKVLEIPTSKGYFQVHFISSAEYEHGSGYVDLCFDPKLKPYLLDLKKNFTSYLQNNVLALPSVYSFRVYELLKQYEFIGHRTIALNDLHFLLNAPQAYQSVYGLFKSRVILKAQEDLKTHTDIFFDFEELKKEGGKKVTHIYFKIHAKHPKQKQQELVEATPSAVVTQTSKVDNPLVQRLLDFGLTQSQVQQMLATYEATYISKNLDEVDSRLEKGISIKNIPAYTLKALKEDFSAKETAYERKKTRINQEKEQQLQKVKELADLQQNLENTYLTQLYAQCERIIQENGLQGLADDFLESSSILIRDIIDKDNLQASDYLKNRFIRASFAHFIAKRHLPNFWHSFESWRENSENR